jgi:hypothetical protein
VVDTAVTREHDHRRRVAIAPEHLEKLDAVDAGQLKVADDEIDVAALQQVKGLAGVPRGDKLMSGALDELTQGAEDIRLVVDA